MDTYQTHDRFAYYQPFTTAQACGQARSSVFRYKGKDVPPQQVGKRTQVQAILNGRVVQRGNDLTLHIRVG
jgi:hypothetical protein